ncbi:MAG: T9SS type A sorting domain-containing protein [bacterium]|nr:T9SS type A sorting domain-containing protein [Candidatus Kapabacteria bacterium]
MKIRSILFTLTVMALAHPAIAQEAPELPKYSVSEEVIQQGLLQPTPDTKATPSLMEEFGYFWLSRHFQRLGPDAQGENRDSNRINLYMPWNIGIEVRGYGQIFAPGMFYTWFNTLANDTTGLLANNLTGGTAVEYYDQFKNATDFTIDTMQMYWFKNPNGGTPLAGAKFYVYRSPDGLNDKTYFNATGSTSYRTRGVRFDRDNLPIAFETDFTPDAIDTTIAGDFINPVVIGFDPPLTFQSGQFAIPFIINDDGEALSDVGGANDIRDYQIMASWWDRRSGERQGFGTNQGYKSLGVTMFRPLNEFTTDRDTVYSLWNAIVFGAAPNQVPAHMSTWMNFFGTVELNAGVRYHYGREASSQGLGTPTPNPVVSNSRVPFSITEITDVAIDLYDLNGTHIRSLVNNRYVPGNYSIALGVDDLANGAYVVRMITGESAYSMKVNVAK